MGLNRERVCLTDEKELSFGSTEKIIKFWFEAKKNERGKLVVYIVAKAEDSRPRGHRFESTLWR